MKRIVSIIAALAMLLLSVSCVAGNTDEDTTNAPATSEVDNVIDTGEETEFKAFGTVDLENYEGYTYNILYTQTENFYRDFHAEQMNGNIMNDVIFARNLQVEEALDIDLEIKWQNYAQVNTDLQTQCNAGTYDYDMYGGHRTSLALSYGGFLTDYSDISQIDLSGEWWDQGWVDTMSYRGSIYTLVGDISVSSLLLVQALCFNKKLFDDNGLDYPYELVREKKWTVDALLSLIENYSTDLNNDGDLTWDSDQFGLTGWGTEAGFSIFYGSGFSFVTKNAEDVYEINFDAERLSAVTDKLYDIWVSASSYFNNNGTVAEHPYPFRVFTEDRALFCDAALCKIGSFLTGMEADYGILPQPMFDENQEDYCSYTGYSIPLIMVPVNAPDLDRTGTIMEALCTASYDGVIPDMYQIVTEVRNARDIESGEMIRIIIRTKTFDPGHWYNIAGYGSYSRSMIASKTKNVASFVRANGTIAGVLLGEINKAFDKMQK